MVCWFCMFSWRNRVSCEPVREPADPAHLTRVKWVMTRVMWVSWFRARVMWVSRVSRVSWVMSRVSRVSRVNWFNWSNKF